MGFNVGTEFWLTYFKELILGAAWPSVAIFALAYFRRPLREALHNLAARMATASSVDVFGVRATFAEQKRAEIEEEAKRAADALAAVIPQAQPAEVEEAIKGFIHDRELVESVLRVIGARGIMDHNVLVGEVSRLWEGAVSPGDIEAGLGRVIAEGELQESDGKVRLTPDGWKKYRAKCSLR